MPLQLHSLYGQVLGELGILGTTLFSMLLIFGAVSARSRNHAAVDDPLVQESIHHRRLIGYVLLVLFFLRNVLAQPLQLPLDIRLRAGGCGQPNLPGENGPPPGAGGNEMRPSLPTSTRPLESPDSSAYVSTMSHTPESRLLHVRASNFFGGPERQIAEHVIAMRGSAFHCEVLTFDENGRANGFYEELRERDIPARRIAMRHLLDVSVLAALRTVVSDGFDIVCTHGYKPTLLMWALRRSFPGKIIAFARGRTRENAKVRMLQSSEEFAFRFLDGVVAVSESERRRVRSALPAKVPVWTVHNSINVAADRYSRGTADGTEVRRDLGIGADVPLLVCAGRLSPEKGQRVLLNALPNIVKRLPCTTVFCGDGPDRSHLESLSVELGVDDDVRFAGHCSDMQPYYSAMDALVLPSLSEGLPNVVLESMASGKPVIAANVGGVPEVVEDGWNGALFTAGDHDALATAVISTLSDQEIIDSFTMNGFSRIETDFSFSTQAARLSDIYNEVLKNA